MIMRKQKNILHPEDAEYWYHYLFLMKSYFRANAITILSGVMGRSLILKPVAL